MSMAIQYTESMDAVLDWFDGQPCACATVGHITDELEYSRETVRNNLKQLAAAEYVEVRHEATGTYRIIDDPRSEGER
jgi:DNA-binding IclR family transcriptional regulator